MDYSRAQELWNGISHGVGSLFGLTALILLMLKVNGVFPHLDNVVHDGLYALKLGTSLFYSLAIFVCMGISCIYHSLRKNAGKKVLRVLDHAMIYLLILGSYAPFCLVGLRDALLWNIPGTEWSGYLIFGLCFLLIVIGLVFSSVGVERFKVVSMIMYLLGGSAIFLNIGAAYVSFGAPGFWLVIGGGAAYFLGAALYGAGRMKSLWFHTVFHFMILLGIVLHFLSIYLFII